MEVFVMSLKCPNCGEAIEVSYNKCGCGYSEGDENSNYSPSSDLANAMMEQNGANDRVLTDVRPSSPAFIQVCLCLTGILVFMGRLSSPSAASLVSPILCFLAAAKVSKGCSRVGFIALMILPIITTVINLVDRPNFVFEMYFSFGALAMLVISLVMWLSYRPEN
jgi:hypothetical protein